MEDTETRADGLVRTPIVAEECPEIAIIELLFFAYRDFTSDPDRILSGYGFGRAHHRVLHFVNRMPGLTVAELLDVLAITKQSLARVLKQLVDSGYIVQLPGSTDRRQRELYPTHKGRALSLTLAAPQSRRIGRAFRQAGESEREVIVRFLMAMVNPDRRALIGRFPGEGGNREGE